MLTSLSASAEQLIVADEDFLPETSPYEGSWDIVWLRDQWRLQDNEAVSSASSTCCVFVVTLSSSDASGKTPRSHYLHRSLLSLSENIRNLGGVLHVSVTDDPVGTIVSKAILLGSRNVYMPFSSTLDGIMQERELTERMPPHILLRIASSGSLLPHAAAPLHFHWRDALSFFEPFLRSLHLYQRNTSYEPLPAPRFILSGGAPSQQIQPLMVPSWAEEVMFFWTPGEEAARQKLLSFLETPILPEAYQLEFDPMLVFSPHFEHGELSLREAFYLAKEKCRELKKNSPQGRALSRFVMMLQWYEFARYMKRSFDRELNFSVASTTSCEKAKQKTRRMVPTGISFLDAIQQQMMKTGYLSPLAKMILADHAHHKEGLAPSDGERWFAHTLIDGGCATDHLLWQRAQAVTQNMRSPLCPHHFSKVCDADGHYQKAWSLT